MSLIHPQTLNLETETNSPRVQTSLEKKMGEM